MQCYIKRGEESKNKMNVFAIKVLEAKCVPIDVCVCVNVFPGHSLFGVVRNLLWPRDDDTCFYGSVCHWFLPTWAAH